MPDEEHTEIIKGVEAVAKVESKATKLTITIQRRIEGITVYYHRSLYAIGHELIFRQQRLGTLALRATDDEEIDMFEWCASAVASKNKTNEELQVLRATLSGKDEQVKKLEDSFAELITLKNNHEKSLLEKFSLLLNEKKLKIRDQQRLLASSNVDPAKLQALEATRRDSKSRSAGPSRKGKRKVEEKEDSDSDEGFEKMEVDKEEAAPDSEDEDRRTPDAESTADETESEGEAPEPPSPPPKKTVNESKASGRNARADSLDSPPRPQRSLPSRNPAPPPKYAPVDGSETESDDDEL